MCFVPGAGTACHCLREGIAVEICLGEAFVYIVDGCFRRVFHVGGIETVVAEVVVHYFKSREIVAASSQCVDGKMKGCFADGVSVESVGKVSYRAYSQKNPVDPAFSTQTGGELLPAFCDFIDAEPPPDET